MVTPVAIVGEREEVERFLATRDGARIAREIAASVLADEERLTPWELGFGPELPAPVKRELERLVARRNAQGRA